MTIVELQRLIRCARDCRERNTENQLLLEERQRSIGPNIHEAEAILQLQNDNYVLSSAIEKLWALDLDIPNVK
jgi:hypothetical protein